MDLEKWPWGNVAPENGEHERYSMAVSAKRQADAMERIAAALWGDRENTGVLAYLQMITERR